MVTVVPSKNREEWKCQHVLLLITLVSGFSGADCSVSDVELAIARQQREIYIDRLVTVVELNEPSTENVTGWISTLASLASNPSELSASTCRAAQSIIGSVMAQVSLLLLPSTIDSCGVSINVVVSESGAIAMTPLGSLTVMQAKYPVSSARGDVVEIQPRSSRHISRVGDILSSPAHLSNMAPNLTEAGNDEKEMLAKLGQSLV